MHGGDAPWRNAAYSEAPDALSNVVAVPNQKSPQKARFYPGCRCANLARIGSTGDGMDRRHFIGSAALAALLPLVGGSGSAIAAPRRRLLPAALNPGDTVALVSP